ncbi:MAG: hypothetical protein FWE34_05770 [Defluviitaleaceae bacterium]|nr:hypothetical protein [Defluviitaleaceae bacterium]
MNYFVRTFILLGIPLIWWFATTGSRVNFFEYVGLKQVINSSAERNLAKWIIIGAIFVLLMPSAYSIVFPEFFASPDTSDMLNYTNAWALTYTFAIHPIFLTGFLKEVGFRGFLGKRLIAKFGFAIGNTAQAVVFGIGHNMLGIFLGYGAVSGIGVFLITGGFGWLAGFITEKRRAALLCLSGFYTPLPICQS